MSKRKSKKSTKPDAATSDVAKPKRAVSAAQVAGLEAAQLEAAPEAETKLPELPSQETETILPPISPPELESQPALPPDAAELKPDVAAGPAEKVVAEAGVSAACTATGASKMAHPSPAMDGPRRAIAGMEACQTLLMEMTRDNLDLAASLASMRSPLDIIDVATKFAGRRIGMYGRFSKTVADIAVGRQASMT